MISASPSTDALWLETLHRIIERAAHELKGAMNGVSVNLEVVRSRSAKAGNPASAVASFAESAATQFDAVIAMTEAMLALSRSAKGPVDVGTTVRRIEALLGPAARADGRQLRIDGTLEAIGATSADGSAVRLAIGAAMLAAIESSADARCSERGRALRIDMHDGSRAQLLAGDVVAAAREAGIEIQAERSAISISFPR